jgi:hypothetical protein
MTEPKKRTRLNVRIPSDLLRWAKRFAKAKNSTVTQIIIDHLTDKRGVERYREKSMASGESRG